VAAFFILIFWICVCWAVAAFIRRVTTPPSEPSPPPEKDVPAFRPELLPPKPEPVAAGPRPTISVQENKPLIDLIPEETKIKLIGEGLMGKANYARITAFKNACPFRPFTIHSKTLGPFCIRNPELVALPTPYKVVFPDLSDLSMSIYDVERVDLAEDKASQDLSRILSLKNAKPFALFYIDLKGLGTIPVSEGTGIEPFGTDEFMIKIPIDDETVALHLRRTVCVHYPLSDIQRIITGEEAQRLLRERDTQDATSVQAEWDGLILPTNTKKSVQIYCDILKNYKLYIDQGVPMPKGLLFYGPPGCGKTETARVISKMAGFFFKSLSSADLKVGFIGQAAVAIQNAFNEARTKAPSVVFIDEIEASCPIRTGGCNDVIDREVLAQLLQESDGIKSTDTAPVFVFGGTNRPELIDPALLERFTERLEIPLPDVESRVQLLRKFIGRIPLEDHDTTVAHVALLTEGLSGRALKNLVTVATKSAIARSLNDPQRRVTLKEDDFFTEPGRLSSVALNR
jgi:AAA+ superfamily predicted ATPase